MPAKLELLWGLLGVVVGGTITWFTQWYIAHEERLTQQRIATMKVASQIRLWLVDVTRALEEHSILQEIHSGGDPNNAPYPSVQHFAFENDLALVTALP